MRALERSDQCSGRGRGEALPRLLLLRGLRELLARLLLYRLLLGRSLRLRGRCRQRLIDHRPRALLRRRRPVTATHRERQTDTRGHGSSLPDRGDRALSLGGSAEWTSPLTDTDVTATAQARFKAHGRMVVPRGHSFQAVRESQLTWGARQLDFLVEGAFSSGFCCASSLRIVRSSSCLARRRFCLRRRGASCGVPMAPPLTAISTGGKRNRIRPLTQPNVPPSQPHIAPAISWKFR